MSSDFDLVHNHHERAVFAAVHDASKRYPQISDKGMLADVACVALNRLAPRYIRHEVDFSFYLSESERRDNQQAVDEAVQFAFEFVQARTAMKAR